jgi:DNA-binding ferritin-like protein
LGPITFVLHPHFVEQVNKSLNHIDELIEKVFQAHRDTLNEVEELKVEVKRHKDMLKAKEEEISSLKDKAMILSMARNLESSEGSESTRELKLKINEIMREVDKCIGMLNQ